MNNIGSTVLMILEFIAAFGVLVFVHEFGHFILARVNKIEVEEFGFGYPPKLLKLFKAWGTEFTLNWIPFGGFCRMKGESGENHELGSFFAAKPGARLTTLLGGSITNLLLGMLVFAFIFSRTGAPDFNKVLVSDVEPGTPAEIGGLQVGDIITTINGTTIDNSSLLSQTVREKLGEELDVVILRGEDELALNLTPRTEWPEDQGPLGVTISNPVNEINFIQAIPTAFVATLDQGVQLVMLPVRLISGQIAPAEARMVSVKGIYDMYAQVQTIDKEEAALNPEMAGLNILWFFAVISIALGYTNLLPIPALDGGRILFLIPEILFHKKVRPELEGKIHAVAYGILITLMVVLIINDIVNPVVLPR